MTQCPVPPKLPETAVYTSCWCEENVYLLGKQLMESQADFMTKWDAYAIFISNKNKTVAICQANGCRNPNLIPGHWGVVWDYHAILIVTSKCTPRASWVYDFDSRLAMGCPFREYIRGTFPPEILLNIRVQSWFRIVELQNFLDFFASDRSHMLRSLSDGEATSQPAYLASPPEYPPIQGTLCSCTNNLFSRYVDMTPSDLAIQLDGLNLEQLKAARYGRVVTLEVLQEVFES